VLVGHSDAAVHLHPFAHRKRSDFGGLGLGDRHMEVSALVADVEKLGRLECCGAGDFDLNMEMGSAVLQRLELADQLSELLALAKIVERSCGRPSGHTDQFRRRAGISSGKRTFERAQAAVDVTDDRVGIELDIVKAQPRRLGAVDQRCALDLKSGRPLRDSEQR